MNKEDQIIKKLLDQNDRLERIENTLATQKELGSFKDEVITRQDEMITILKRLDQERIFTHEWVKRLEDDVKKNTKDILKLKQVLKIA
jgi:ribosomal protein L17